jgi:hypothetical protein
VWWSQNNDYGCLDWIFWKKDLGLNSMELEEFKAIGVEPGY